MLLVLDSNEYIFSFGSEPKSSCTLLVEQILQEPALYSLRICRTTIEDVRDHVSRGDFRDFIRFLQALDVFIDEDELVPFELGGKYLTRGLKPGDAFLAGYTEWVGADCLISENRKDFVNHPRLFPFKVRTAEHFLEEHPRKTT